MNFVATEEEETTGHGKKVFDIIRFASPDSMFSFYRTIVYDEEKEKGIAKRSNVADAIYKASQHGVDILNLSLGVCHSEEEGHDCGELCRIADEARLAIKEDGMTIVAATGNGDNADAVTCPALVSTVIGVGGYVSKCPENIDYTGESSQYWVNGDQTYGPFCGHQGCRSDDCSTNSVEVPWEDNVSFHNAVPDILAPVVRATCNSGNPTLEAGTSFAAPLISGRVATVLSDITIVEGKHPDTEDIRRGLRLSGVELDQGHMTKYNEEGFFYFLRDNT